MLIQPLVISDYRAGRVYRLVDGALEDLPCGVLAEHAGALTLDPGTWAYVDDRGGAVVLSHGSGQRRIPVAIPAEHMACDPAGEHLAVTTGSGANPAPWSDVVTVIDRHSGASRRFRTRTGEPGVLIVPDQVDGTQHVVLRHREPGAIEAIPWDDCLGVGAHVPPLTGHVCTEISHDGHGDVVDHRTGIFATATGRGLERFVVDGGVPRPLGIVPWPVAGRAFYLRCDPVTGTALGVVRGGADSPRHWTRWHNTFVEIDLVRGTAAHTALPPGLAFRFGLGGERAAVATIHPDGDSLSVLHREARTGASPAVHRSATLPLPAMSHPPAPGHVPWEAHGASPAQRRAVAVDPTGTVAAVSRGGDGQVHLIHLAGGRSETLAVPTRLDEGGHLYWTGVDQDPVGR